MISKFINFRIFLISLSIGIFMTYIFIPEKTIIYVYPTPDNENQIFFKDTTNNCFKFNSKEVNCPSESSLITSIPIQD